MRKIGIIIVYFNCSDTAVGYAEDRPYFHPIVIDRIKSYLNLKTKFENALDVGCGAGLSSIALLDIAQKVVGIDSSPSMISSAVENDSIEYFNYSAEDLPFDQNFEIITLSGSINWINRERFFSRSQKVTNDQSRIVIYDNNILGEMENNTSFSHWYENVFLTKYPKPPRDESPLEEELLSKYGFELEHEEQYTNKIVFSLERFISYLLTQSNITVALNKATINKEKVISWLESSLIDYFGSTEKVLLFGGYIWFIRKV